MKIQACDKQWICNKTAWNSPIAWKGNIWRYSPRSRTAALILSRRYLLSSARAEPHVSLARLCSWTQQQACRAWHWPSAGAVKLKFLFIICVASDSPVSCLFFLLNCRQQTYHWKNKILWWRPHQMPTPERSPAGVCQCLNTDRIYIGTYLPA